MKIEMAPSVVLENLENLYFELVPKKIDLRKKHPTYLSKEKKKNSNLLSIEAVKKALQDTDKTKLKSISLIGSEPLYNPDFNKILRLCMKIAPTTVITGGQNINEKKARFLAKVQTESSKNYPLHFIINLYHYDERINDTYCQRGDFRKVMHAIDSLQKYDFFPTIHIKNLTNSPEQDLSQGFEKIFCQYRLMVLPEIKIFSNQEKEIDLAKFNFISVAKNLHCAKARVFSSYGVFSCPHLAGDYRARVGYNMKSFSKTNYLETDTCKSCIFQEIKRK